MKQLLFLLITVIAVSCATPKTYCYTIYLKRNSVWSDTMKIPCANRKSTWRKDKDGLFYINGVAQADHIDSFEVHLLTMQLAKKSVKLPQ